MSEKGSEHDDDIASASGKSGTSGGQSASETSSQRADAKLLQKRRTADNNEEDLLEQRRNIMEGVFACMYTLVRQTAFKGWQMAVLKIILEGLMSFIVCFNPASHAFLIDTNNSVWQFVRWTVWRSPIIRLYGYTTYITILYVTVGAVLIAVVGLAWLTLAMRKQEQSKWLRVAAITLHMVYDVMFMIFYVSMFDYLVFTFSCNYSGDVKHHMYFTDVMCFEMPHLMHLVVAGVTAVLFFLVTALMVIASSDLNPISLGYLASPAVYARLKVLCAKAVYVIVAAALDAYVKPQALIMAACVGLICWWNLRALPFYRNPVNIVWCGEWIGILYTVILLNVIVFSSESENPEFRREQTMNVLYGIFPVIAGGMVLTALYSWWAMLPAKKFKHLEPGIKLTKVHQFSSVYEVERLARVMRAFDLDFNVDEAAATHGEVIIKAGLQAFPNTPYLLILYANFLLEVKKDGPASRTQLQLASRHSPSLVERYQVFCTNESSKRLKDSQDGGMDLQAYCEFKRNFRAVLRVHKEALLIQADLWKLFLRNTLRVAEVDSALDALEVAAGRANQVYKRVLERYPNNGRLLRCYGRFLEDVRNDPIAAARAYSEANRNGGGDALLNIDVNGMQEGGKPEMLTSMTMEDAVIVINAEGTIMMVTQAVQTVFGYAKAELEGANVSVLMPQPFSQRHPSYMQRYVGSGEPHILDAVREVVAMHKERYVFPATICVTKLSGTGTDSIFLGVVRTAPPNALTTRAWISPNGVFLCGDASFASMVGVTEGDLVGKLLTAMVPSDMAAKAETLLQECRDAPADVLMSGSVRMELSLTHRYLDPVPVEVTAGMAGSDAQRIIVLSCRRLDGRDGTIMVVDAHMRIKFASVGVSSMLGYSMRKLATMRLDQLLPPPYNTLHMKWLKDQPRVKTATSCRSGVVVHLLNDAGVPVHMRLQITSVENTDPGAAAGTLHVIQIDRVSQADEAEERRLVLTVDFTGRVCAVSPPTSQLFDFPASALVGTSLCDSIDVFDEWRERNGEEQMQLLLLAMLDKEQEMPGASWRVRIQQPKATDLDQDDKLPPIPGATAAPKAKAVVARSACLQVEIAEHNELAAEGDDTAATHAKIKIVLWRRDLLSGVIEMDEDMTVRKASPATGYIVGWPVSFLMKQPLRRFLEIPPAAKTWEQLAAMSVHTHKKSALKATNNRGTISPALALIGPHPDEGTMRLLVQGVQTLGPGGKVKITATLHPDTTFTGARANLMRVLHLENVGGSVTGAGQGAATGAASIAPTDIAAQELAAEQEEHQADADAALASSAADPDAAGADNHSEASHDDERALTRRVSEMSEGTREHATLHKQATSKSEFVANWVRTLTKKVSHSHAPSTAAAEAAAQPQHATSGGLLAIQLPPRSPLPAIPEDGVAKRDDGLDAVRPGSATMQTQLSKMRSGSGRVSPSGSLRKSKSALADDVPGGPAADGGPGGGDDKLDKVSESNDDSSVDEGSQAASAFSGTDQSSVAEVVVDARRSRLLKALSKVVLGPTLTQPLLRLRYHSYGLIAVLLITHIVCYVVISDLIHIQKTNVEIVHRQAMAMDRAQLIVVRCMMGAFCERANVTAKVSTCSNPLDFTIRKLRENIELMEQHVQAVYFGLNGLRKLSQPVYDVWNAKHLDYHVYLDTQPPAVIVETAGAWQLGNRFLAAARESLYWLPTLRDEYKMHRTWQFIVSSGLGALFEGFASSLDLLMTSSWAGVSKLRIELVVLLVVEALCVQLACSAYQWYLLQRLETARQLGILAMLGLPGPVLRQMATRELKILDDSDEESDNDDDEEEQEARAKEKAELQAGESSGKQALLGKDSGSGKGLSFDDEHAPAAAPEKAAATAKPDAGTAHDPITRKATKTPSRLGLRAKLRAFRERATASTGLHIKGKSLVPSRLQLTRFMMPLFIWNLAVIAIYIASLIKLKDMQGPLASLNMASHVVYRYTRVRAYAFGMVSADDGTEKAVWRENLMREMRLFEDEYDTVLYGGVATSQESEHFQEQVPASTFASTSFAQAFFRDKRCFLYDQSQCLEPDHEFYEASRNGLDAMVRRVIMEMTLLALDADEDATYNSTRYTFMHMVGGRDCYDGLQQAAQLFVDYSTSAYSQVTQLHTILLVVTIVMALCYILFLLRPHLERVKSDAVRQCAMLSHAPPELLDVRAHVRAVYKRQVMGRKK